MIVRDGGTTSSSRTGPAAPARTPARTSAWADRKNVIGPFLDNMGIAEADLDRGGVSVLDIRPLVCRDGWSIAGENVKAGTDEIESAPTGWRSSLPSRVYHDLDR
jgi:hypothetical protein